MKQIELTTTLALLKKYKACDGRYQHLVEKLGPRWTKTRKLPLSKILELNGLDDALWALQATATREKKQRDRQARLMACDMAERVLKFYEKFAPNDTRPADAIRASREFADAEGSAADAAHAAWSAADAAHAAWWSAADAAQSAARSAAAAAWSAAWNAADAADAADAAWSAEKKEQEKIYLKWVNKS